MDTRVCMSGNLRDDPAYLCLNVRRAAIQKAPAKRIVPTPSLNVNINENDSHYNYTEIKITLRTPFFTI